MDMDPKSHEPLIITPKTRGDDYKIDEKVTLPATIISMDSGSHHSPVAKDSSTLHLSDQKKVKIVANLTEISHRLTQRKNLQNRCRQSNDLMCLIVLSSIALMIVTNELMFVSLVHRETKVTWFLKLAMTISTVALIILLIYYHYVVMLLHAVNRSLRYWYVGLNGSKIFQIILEICICAIHPFPRGFPAFDETGSEQNNDNSTLFESGKVPLTFVSTDVLLGIPMFARLYILCRAITYHSDFLESSSSRSIGYLNKVPIDFFFVVKAYLEQSPTLSLLTICTIIVSMGSWSMRACNYTSTDGHLSISNSMWLFFTLFTTVGYGDLVPNTYCGRGVATLTALTGVIVTAFLIAVLSQKLLLSRREKYIYTFVVNIQLAKSQKDHAANIILHAWRMWKLNKMGRDRSAKYLTSERKFYASVSAVREIKRARLQLPDNVIGLPEIMMNVQRDTNEKTVEAEAISNSHEARLNDLEKLLQDVKGAIYSMDNRLSLILQKNNEREEVSF